MKCLDLLIGTGGGERVFFKIKEDVVDGKLTGYKYSMRKGNHGAWTDLPFAIYLDEVDSESLKMDFKAYVENRKAGEDARSKSECLRELRERYIGGILDRSGGNVVYIDKTNRGYVLGRSEMVSSVESN